MSLCFEEWWGSLAKDGLENRTGVELCKVLAHMAWVAAIRGSVQDDPLGDIVKRLHDAARRSRDYGRTNNAPLLDEAAIEIARLNAALAGKQARIDRLMMEYCPDEMTEDQVATWERHQRAVADDSSNAAQGDGQQENK